MNCVVIRRVSISRILAAKQQNPAADPRALEAELDRLVYALYGLTAEEITLVEGQTRNQTGIHKNLQDIQDIGDMPGA
jgi:hypothetical protein